MTDQHQLYDELLSATAQCRVEALVAGVKEPKLRTVMTYDTWQAVIQAGPGASSNHNVMRGTYAYFNGSIVTIIPGDDIFHSTRCTNLH